MFLLGWVTVWRGEGHMVALKVLPMLPLLLWQMVGDIQHYHPWI
jgi:hypothetical protein